MRPKGHQWVSQTFRTPEKILPGQGPGEVEALHLTYRLLDVPGCRERAVDINERVIWIIRKTDRGAFATGTLEKG